MKDANATTHELQSEEATMDLDAWAAFFGAQVAGSAALLGLLFVGISLNLATVLREQSLPDRALVAMVLLLSILLTASVALLPGLSVPTLGLILLAVSLAVAAGGANYERRILRAGGPQSSLWAMNAALFALSAILPILGSLTLIYGSASGLYWVATGMLVSLVKAVLDAWVLLVEVNR